jgi:hypothetical protein
MLGISAMDNERLDAPTGRDIAGGWLLCAIIGALALILASVFHGGMSPAVSAATAAAAGPNAGDTSCAAAAPDPRFRMLAGLRQTASPMPHQDHQPAKADVTNGANVTSRSLLTRRSW